MCEWLRVLSFGDRETVTERWGLAYRDVGGGGVVRWVELCDLIDSRGGWWLFVVGVMSGQERMRDVLE